LSQSRALISLAQKQVIAPVQKQDIARAHEEVWFVQKHNSSPSQKQGLVAVQNEDYALVPKRDIVLGRNQDIAPAQKQDMELFRTDVYKFLQNQDIVFVHRDEIAIVRNQDHCSCSEAGHVLVYKRSCVRSQTRRTAHHRP